MLRKAESDPIAGDAYWSVNTDDLFARLQCSTTGLSTAEAAERLRRYGRNELREERTFTRARLLARQLSNPLLLLLLVAAIVSAITGQWIDASIVFAIVSASVLITYGREYRAHAAAQALKARVRVAAKVLRDGRECMIPLAEVVPGDVVSLSAGNLVPADARVLDATDCFVSESVLTGESFPVEKKARRSIGARTARKAHQLRVSRDWRA